MRLIRVDGYREEKGEKRSQDCRAMGQTPFFYPARVVAGTRGQ